MINFLGIANIYRRRIKKAEDLKYFYITHLRWNDFKELEKDINKRIKGFKQKVDYFDNLSVRNKEI